MEFDKYPQCKGLIALVVLTKDGSSVDTGSRSTSVMLNEIKVEVSTNNIDGLYNAYRLSYVQNQSADNVGFIIRTLRPPILQAGRKSRKVEPMSSLFLPSHYKCPYSANSIHIIR